MRFERVWIEGVSHVLPDVVVRTSALEKSLSPSFTRLGLPSGTLQDMTGVASRRLWREGTGVAEAATLAAEKLLAETGFDRSRLGLLVSTSVSKDFLEPSVAALVHGALGLPERCLNYDLGNACLGFLSGIGNVASLIELGEIEAGLVVAAESSRAVTHATLRRLQQPDADFGTFRDNLATLTLGSASAAMLLVREPLQSSGHRLAGGAALAATEHCKLCFGTNEGMTTDAPRLLTEGVALARRTWTRVEAELGISIDEVSLFALHQVGKANHDAILAALGIPEDRAPRCYIEHGNVGAAGVPLTLSLSAGNQLAPGDLVMLMGIGSGLNVNMMGVRW